MKTLKKLTFTTGIVCLFLGLTSHSTQAQDEDVLKSEPLDLLIHSGAIPNYIPRGLLLKPKSDGGGKDVERVLYYTHLFRLFSSVLPREPYQNANEPSEERATAVQRLAHAMAFEKNEQVKASKIEQILRENRISTIDEFLSVYHLRYAFRGHVHQTHRIPTWGAVALLHFYSYYSSINGLDAPVLYDETPALKNQINTAHRFTKLLRLPDLPNRPHGVDAEKPAYDQAAWDRALEPFYSDRFSAHIPEFDKVRLVVLGILSNYQAGHSASAMIPEIRNRFYDELREFYFANPEARFKTTKDLLLAHFANTGSDKVLKKDKEALAKVFSRVPAKRTLAYFIDGLRKFNQPQLGEFLRNGTLPNRLTTVTATSVANVKNHFHGAPIDACQAAQMRK